MKLGNCVICGERVESKDLYIVAKEGYTHKKCISSMTRGLSA